MDPGKIYRGSAGDRIHHPPLIADLVDVMELPLPCLADPRPALPRSGLHMVDLLIGSKRHPLQMLRDLRASQIPVDSETLDAERESDPPRDAVEQPDGVLRHLRATAHLPVRSHRGEALAPERHDGIEVLREEGSAVAGVRHCRSL